MEPRIWHCKSLLFLLTVFTVSALNAQSNPDQGQKAANPQKGAGKDATYSYTIIPAAEKTWGYDVYRDKHLLIHQPVIPGLPGNKGFKKKSDAEKVAKLVIEKIRKGQMPPTVTTEEMKKLKAI
jgi:hypothetical protein